MKRLDELIAEAAVFEGLSPAQLELIAGCAVNEHVPESTYLFKEGDHADRFYLIRHGAVALEIHSPGSSTHVIETLGEGEIVGWSWLFKPYRWHSDARAIQPTGLVAFDAACLRGKADADHELGYQLMQRFANTMLEHLEATRLQLLDVYGRVAHPA